MRVALCVCVLGASVAQAQPPSQTPPVAPAATPTLLVAANLGIGHASLVDQYGNDDGARSELLQLDVGLRARRAVMVGLHLGVASTMTFWNTRLESMYDESWEYSALPIQLGLTAHVLVGSRFWLAPWLGVQNALQRQDCYFFYDKRVAGGQTTTDCSPQPWESGSTRFAAGFSLSGDVADFNGHRIEIVGSMLHAMGDEEDVMNGSYTGFWLGLGYRFWPDSP